MRRPRRSRRRIITIVLLVAGGAITNLGVAWGIHTFVILDPIDSFVGASWRTTTETTGWFCWAPEVVLAPQGRNVYRGAGWSTESIRWDWKRDDLYRHEGVRMRQQIERRGWPMLSLAASQQWIVPADSDEERAESGALGMWQRGLKPSRVLMFEPRAGPFLMEFPLLPILPGFLVNTLLYTSMLGAPVMLLHGRAARRRRRGRCVKCAYDLSATKPNQPCPECGHARWVGGAWPLIGDDQ